MINNLVLDIATEANTLPRNNLPSNYLPVRNDSKSNHFVWEHVESLFLSYTLNLSLKNYTFDEFKIACKAALMDKLGNEDVWPIIEDMYFSSKDILRSSPEFLMFNLVSDSDITSADKRIAQLLFELLEPDYFSDIKISSELNFIEQEFFDVYKKHVKPSKTLVNNELYLPYLSKVFTTDIKFMFENPKFMQDEFRNMLSFYLFSYCAQLALNVQEWKAGEPSPKPLYYLLDNETASQERTNITHDGFKSLDIALMYLFPVLTMIENLQLKNSKVKMPLWKIAQLISHSGNQDQIASSLGLFANLKKEKEDLRTELPQNATASEWIEKLIELTRDEFWIGNKALKGGMANKYRNQIKNQLGQDLFYRAKGRSGNVLELNQDLILLLTNLSIGNKPKLRFGQLMTQFKLRGVFFDDDSKQELINFYERIGIIQRMSDSGEAVNVRKTI